MKKTVWALTLFLVLIGLLAVARRAYVLLGPPQAPRAWGGGGSG